MTRILVVCTANICRSPVAEAALRAALEGSGIEVSSAGTHAEHGRGADPVAAEYVRRELGRRLVHHARLLTPELAGAADLVLTMTSAQRTLVAELAPRAVRRTFTLRELAKIVEVLPEAGAAEDLRAFAQRSGRLRRTALTASPDQDVQDPFGSTTAAYAVSFGQILDGSARIGAAIRRSVEWPSPAVVP